MRPSTRLCGGGVGVLYRFKAIVSHGIGSGEIGGVA
jgi:hypothetical protein